MHCCRHPSIHLWMALPSHERLHKRPVSSAHWATDVITRRDVWWSHLWHVLHRRSIVKNAITASTLCPLRYGSSNYRQCQADHSSIARYRSVRQAVARTTTTTGSMTVKDSLTLPSIPPHQQDIGSTRDARHRTDSAQLAQRRISMRRTHHQWPASPNWLQMINEWVDNYFCFKSYFF